MKIAIISDIHENAHNLLQFFEQLQQHEVAQVLCLGDLMNVGISKILATSPVPVYSVWGNNDGDRVAITKVSEKNDSNLTMGFNSFDIVEFGGKKIFISHYPMLAKPIAKSGDFDAVFFGHTHEKYEEYIGKCLVLNPGEISGHKTGNVTYAVYDTEQHTVGFFDVENSITLKSDKVDDFYRNSSQGFSNAKHHKR